MTSKPPLTPRQKLLKILGRIDDDGLPMALPIFGSGLNTQAMHSDGWGSLMDAVRGSLRVPKQAVDPTSQTARWESYLRYMSREDGMPPHKAERKLQEVVANKLRPWPSARPIQPLYQHILELGYRDIMTLNFDLLLEHGGLQHVLHSHTIRAKQLSSLYRRYDVRAEGLQHDVRVWHPHGDVGRAGTLRLGIRKYGLYIRELEHQRNNCMKIYKMFSGKSNRGRDFEISQTRDFVRLMKTPNWFALFLHSPVVIIGAGLSYDEWPLWWALHERARYLNRMQLKFPTAIAVEASADRSKYSHLRGMPADIELLEFDSNQVIWDTLLAVRRTART